MLLPVVPWPIHVANSNLVPAPESHAVVFAVRWRDEMGIAVFVAIHHVRLPVVFEILLRAFDSIMEASLLGRAKLRRRLVPRWSLRIPRRRRAIILRDHRLSAQTDHQTNRSC